MFTVYTIKTFVSERGDHICWAVPDPAAPLHCLLLANWKSNLFATIYQHNKHLETQCMASRFTQKLARWDLFSSISQNSSQNRLQKMYQLAAIFRQWQPGSCWCDISHEKSSVEDYINRMMDSTQFHSMRSDIPGAKPWWVHRKFTELWWFNGPNVDWTITTETLHISPYNIAPRS